MPEVYDTTDMNISCSKKKQQQTNKKTAMQLLYSLTSLTVT